MGNPDLFILSALRALVEVAMLALLGLVAVALLSGPKRHSNPIYQLFAVIARPVIRGVRVITPKPIIDKHIPFVAFCLLFWLWIFLAWAKRFLVS
jgi:uncharacterized protein YggT (Ycf19 family)